MLSSPIPTQLSNIPSTYGNPQNYTQQASQGKQAGSLDTPNAGTEDNTVTNEGEDVDQQQYQHSDDDDGEDEDEEDYTDYEMLDEQFAFEEVDEEEEEDSSTHHEQLNEYTDEEDEDTPSQYAQPSTQPSDQAGTTQDDAIELSD